MAAPLLDATGARDIARVTPFRAGEERLGVAMTLDTNLLRDGERLETLIDVDRDPGTGEPASGADVAVDVIGYNGRDGRLVVRRWDAPSGGFADAGIPASAAAFRSGSRDVVWTLPAPPWASTRRRRPGWPSWPGTRLRSTAPRRPAPPSWAGRARRRPHGRRPGSARRPACRSCGPPGRWRPGRPSDPPDAPDPRPRPVAGPPARAHGMARRPGQGRLDPQDDRARPRRAACEGRARRGARRPARRAAQLRHPRPVAGRAVRTRLEVGDGLRTVRRERLVRLR